MQWEGGVWSEGGDMAVTGGELVIIIYGRAEVTFHKCEAAGLCVGFYHHPTAYTTVRLVG